MKISEASNIYVGSSAASAVYLGADLIWPTSTTNVTPDMVHIDVPTFRSSNGISAGSTYQIHDGDYNLLSSEVLNVSPNTHEVIVGPLDHYHLYINSDDTFRVTDDTILTLKGNTYTKIIFKHMYSDTYKNKSTFICSSGSIVYDAQADEYVWTGNDTNVSINMNGSSLRFYDIYYQVPTNSTSITHTQFRSLNNITGDQVQLSNGEYKLVSDNSLKFVVNYESGAGAYTITSTRLSSGGWVLYNNPSNVGYVQIVSTSGSMNRFSLKISNSSYYGGAMQCDTGTISVDRTAGYVYWTGSASAVKIWNTAQPRLHFNTITIEQ